MAITRNTGAELSTGPIRSFLKVWWMLSWRVLIVGYPILDHLRYANSWKSGTLDLAIFGLLALTLALAAILVSRGKTLRAFPILFFLFSKDHVLTYWIKSKRPSQWVTTKSKPTIDESGFYSSQDNSDVESERYDLLLAQDANQDQYQEPRISVPTEGVIERATRPGEMYYSPQEIGTGYSTNQRTRGEIGRTLDYDDFASEEQYERKLEQLYLFNKASDRQGILTRADTFWGVVGAKNGTLPS